jgi:GLPGLI family protein
MKLFAFLTSLLFLATISIAQTEATIEFKIDMSTDDPEMEAQIAMMEGSTMKMYMKDDNMREELSYGGLINITTISNSKEKEAMLLLDGMMGKFAAKKQIDEDSKNDNSEEELDIEFIDETKEIAGYECKKAIIYDAAGNENTFWYTEEIEAPENGSKYVKKGIPGLALEFSIAQPQMRMSFSAVEFSKKVKNPKEKFDLTVPEGFTEKSFEDIQNMLGGA